MRLPYSNKNVADAFKKGSKYSIELIFSALEAEDIAEELDFDNLIGFGIQCGQCGFGADRIALSWVNKRPSEQRFEIFCGFLNGYWQEECETADIRSQVIDSVFVLRDELASGEDAKISSVQALDLGLRSSNLSTERRRECATKLLNIIVNEPEMRHAAMIKIRAEKAALF
ncbi:MAG: hypothetical protein AB8B85_21205 [Paracoccaceae bacterium]